MSHVALEMVSVLVRNSLWLTAAAILSAAVLRVTRATWPAAHRTAWLVTLAVGWIVWQCSVTVPWYDPVTPAELVVGITPPEPADEAAPVEITDLALPIASREPAEPADKPAEEAAEDVATVEIVADPPVELAVPAVDASTETSEVPTIEIGPSAEQPIALPAESPAVSMDLAAPYTPAWTLSDWSLVLLGIWTAGLILLPAAWVAGYLRFVRRLPAGQEADPVWLREWSELLKSAGVGREIPLRVTEELGPMLCWLPRGYELLVPEPLWSELEPTQRRAILRHELAHFLRCDVWSSLAARVLALAHWFNPLAWYAVRRFEEAAEWACDRAATTDVPATTYAKALVRLGETCSCDPAYGPAASGHSLAARVRRVLLAEQREDAWWKKGMLVAAAALLAAVPLVRVELVAQQTESKEIGAQTNVVSDANDKLPVLLSVVATVDGTVSEVLVDDGAEVKKGQLLIRLENPELVTALERMKQEIDKTQKRLDEAKSLTPSKSSEVERAASLLRFDTEALARLEGKILQLTITSPADGKVVAPRLEESLSHRPVHAGEVLLTLVTVPSSGTENDPTASSGVDVIVEQVVDRDPAVATLTQRLTDLNESLTEVRKQAANPDSSKRVKRYEKEIAELQDRLDKTKTELRVRIGATRSKPPDVAVSEPPQLSQEQLAGLKRQAEEAAKEYDSTLADYEAERAPIEVVYGRSLRWMELAERVSRAEKVTDPKELSWPLRAHLYRMRQLQKRVDAFYVVGSRRAAQDDKTKVSVFVDATEKQLARVEAGTEAANTILELELARGVLGGPDGALTKELLAVEARLTVLSKALSRDDLVPELRVAMVKQLQDATVEQHKILERYRAVVTQRTLQQARSDQQSKTTGQGAGETKSAKNKAVTSQVIKRPGAAGDVLVAIKFGEVKAAGTTMVEEAAKAYEATCAAYEAETATIEAVYGWSLRWMGADEAVAVNADAKIAAAQAHVDRMRALQQKIKTLYESGFKGGEAKEMHAANYYLAEAQRKLSQLQDQRKAPPTAASRAERLRALNERLALANQVVQRAETTLKNPKLDNDAQARVQGELDTARQWRERIEDHLAALKSLEDVERPASDVIELKIKIAGLEGQIDALKIDLDAMKTDYERGRRAKTSETELRKLGLDMQKLHAQRANLEKQLNLYRQKLQALETALAQPVDPKPVGPVAEPQAVAPAKAATKPKQPEITMHADSLEIKRPVVVTDSAQPEAQSNAVIDLEIRIAELEGQLDAAKIDFESATSRLEQGSQGTRTAAEVAALERELLRAKAAQKSLERQLELYRRKLKAVQMTTRPTTRRELGVPAGLAEPAKEPTKTAQAAEATKPQGAAQPKQAEPPRAKVESVPTDARVVSDKVARHPELLGIQAKPKLLYDGKDFDQWANELRTDLSPTRRIEAVEALAAFGEQGEARRTAEVIMDVMRSVPMQSLVMELIAGKRLDEGPVTQFKRVAIRAIGRQASSDAIPVLVQALKSENENQRWLALGVLFFSESLAKSAEIQQALPALLKDTNLELRRHAAYVLANVGAATQEIFESVHSALVSQDASEVQWALQTILKSKQPTSFAALAPRLAMIADPELTHKQVILATPASADANRSTACIVLSTLGKPALDELEKALQTAPDGEKDRLRRWHEVLQGNQNKAERR